MRDTDATGIVFHPRYLEIATAARESFIDSLGFSGGLAKTSYNQRLVAYNLSMRFRGQCLLRDNLIVRSAVASLTNSKIKVTQQILRDGQEVVLINIDFVMTDSLSNKPVLLSDELVKKLKKYAY
jgi:YbgC/YbaW family acyl-CoA thioester hydrolase